MMDTDAASGEGEVAGAAGRPAALFSPPERPGWEWALSLAWVAGALGLWIPFFFLWRLGAGHFAYNIGIGIAAGVFGGAAVAVWTLLFRRATSGSLRSGTTAAVGHLCGAIAFAASGLGWVPFGVGMWTGVGCVLGAGIAAYFAALNEKNGRRVSELPGDAVGRFFRPARPWNVWFWLLLLVLFVGRDTFYLITNIQAGGFTKGGIFVARLGTQLMVVAAIAISIRMSRALLPRKAAWAADFAASLIVGFTLADFLATEMWQPLIPVINGLTSSGRFDLGQELEASGLGIGPFVALALLFLFALGCFAFYGALAWLSRRTVLRPSSAALLFVGILGWGVAAGEQAVSRSWKSIEVWQSEVATFPLQIGPLRPRVGMVSFDLEFANPAGGVDHDGLVEGMAQESPGMLRARPDIYIFMIESLRRDAIVPANAPFLSRFAELECQQFGETYAASNCTPLSWFGTFHSRVPVFWSGALSERDGQGRRPGAYPLRLLLAAGYKLEVRAINDLGYKDISTLHFGTAQHLAGVYKDDFGRSEGYGFGEREKFLFEDLKSEVIRLPYGGNVHIIALDSTHYNYYWPNDFPPTHTEFDEDLFLGMSPTPEQLERVKNRYHNAVGWVDHALDSFTQFLKSEDRYDESVIIVTGDHGEEFQEHGSWFHCSALVRQQTEVPILIKWPSSLGETPRWEMASHLDIMPSLLDSLGIPKKYRAPLSGRSLISSDPQADEGTIITTGWAGRSGVAMAFVKPGLKASFTWAMPWENRVPSEAHLKQFSELLDTPIMVNQRGAAGRLREEFGGVISRFFTKFEEN